MYNVAFLFPLGIWLAHVAAAFTKIRPNKYNQVNQRIQLLLYVCRYDEMENRK